MSWQWQLLLDNIGRGNTTTFNKPTFPKGEIHGVGFHEAPQGVLPHWVVSKDAKITNYQAVVPTIWNATPRNEGDVAYPFEAPLLNTQEQLSLLMPYLNHRRYRDGSEKHR